MAAETKRGRAPGVVRKLREQDAAAVTEILRGAPEAVFWPESGVKEVLTSQGALALVSEVEGKVIGFLIGRKAADEAEILNLAVTQGSRRRGEGNVLLKAALGEFRAQGASRVFLEVREANSAGIAFYEQHGFSKIGRREGYYREPFEAAVVMEKKITG